MSITGAELIVSLLEQQGVRTVAGIPGGAVLPLYEALGASRQIRHVLARHEQGAGFIAHGMARISGTPAVCLATSGPGVTNLLTALADAKLDSVPLICITGQVPQQLIGTDAFQEVPTGRIVDSLTKANFFVRSAGDLLDVIPEAFRIAAEGRPGPVWIDVPKDVQMQRIAPSALPAPLAAAAALAPDAEAIRQAADLIHRAQRPVLYLGGGVVKARAHHWAQAVAQRSGLPTVMTLMALGALPSGHPLALGMLGMHGPRYVNRVLDECDLLIAVGARFDDRATGRTDAFCPQARVIHIDVDRRELGKIRKPELAIQADAALALEALLSHLRRRPRTAWLKRVGDLRREFPLRMPGLDNPRMPYGLIRAVAEHAGPDAIVTTDVGQHQMWVAQAYPFQRPDRWMTSGGLGTMGFGLPAAIGAALTLPGTPAVCFTGDGSLLMNVQELATLADLQLPVKIVLFDNASLGLVRQQQTLFYGGRYVGSDFTAPTDFRRVAEAFGIPATDLATVRNANTALGEALARPGPTLIRLPVSADQHVLPMVKPGASNLEVVD